jgi:hypothetical protein
MRLFVSFGLALLGVFASTGFAHAATDRTEVMVGTFLVVLGLMSFLFLVFLIKWILGVGSMPPPDADAGDHAHH